ncbi:MAG: hypothetical protein WBM13_12275 [Bacteroidia bacterium]
MKKIALFVLLFVGLSTVSFAQSGKEKSGGFFSKFGGTKKPRKQIKHFDQSKKDPNMEHNGTSYRRDRKSKYVLDGDGFGTAGQGKQKKRKKKK